MNRQMSSMLSKALLAGALVVGTASVGSTASAAPPTAVDFTVSETLPLAAPGVMIASDVPGCPNATVATSPTSATTSGPVTRFTGTKDFDCGGGNSFTLTYRASVRGCATTDSGRWKITGGTGVFAGAKGSGALVGTYWTTGGGPGDACVNDGIDDRYTGKIKLP